MEETKMVNITRIKREGITGKKYIFFRDDSGKQRVIPNKFGKEWWKRAKKSDILRVSAV
tara:strand:- start:6846 stop:7022 length:177 start_codon:yes stop_codon:yes gene_type:complete